MSQGALFSDPQFVELERPRPRKPKRPDPVPSSRAPFAQPQPQPQPDLLGDSPPAPQPRRLRAPVGVVEQVRVALRPGARLAFVVGMLLGGFVPVATFVLAHAELVHGRPLWLQPAAAFVAGGLLFSAVTMYRWGRLAFDVRAKAVGFVLLLEGTMVTSSTRWLSLVALAYLVLINGVATACNLARPRDVSEQS